MKEIAIVTGASRGIGKSIAIELGKKGYFVICIAKQNQQGLLATIEEIIALGGNAHPILCDISNPVSVQEMFEEIQLFTFPITVLINNAGISLYKLFTETSFEDWQYVMNTNLNSLFYVTKPVAKEMIHNKKGTILNISSIWGNDGASMEVAYSTSKAGVNGFTKALAKELGPSGIRVNAVACGVIDTDMNAMLSSEERRELENEISLGRYGTSLEVARFVTSILHDATYLNGQILTYDGGMY